MEVGLLNIDEDPRNADWIRAISRAREFAEWTAARIDAECATRYGEYLATVGQRHQSYTAAQAKRVGSESARLMRREVFPPGWEHLVNALPEDGWHRHHLSPRSSQILAV